MVKNVPVGRRWRLHVGGKAVRGIFMAGRHCSSSRWRLVLEVLLGLVITNEGGMWLAVIHPGCGPSAEIGAKTNVDPMQVGTRYKWPWQPSIQPQEWAKNQKSPGRSHPDLCAARKQPAHQVWPDGQCCGCARATPASPSQMKRRITLVCL